MKKTAPKDDTFVLSDKKETVKKRKKPLERVAAQIHKSDTDEVEKLLHKNLVLSEKIFNQNEKIKHRLLMMVIGNYIRLALILTPFILVFIYLPAFFRDISDAYKWLLGFEPAEISENNEARSTILEQLADPTVRDQALELLKKNQQ